MNDIQNLEDIRGVKIDKVGIKSLKFPLNIADKNKIRQNVFANIDMFVDLPKHFKGTHMSRFVEIMNSYRLVEMNSETIFKILKDIKNSLESESAYVNISFPYFIEKKSPVTKYTSLINYDCGFYGKSQKDYVSLIIEIGIPVTSLCPCSKEISENGAHNQRGKVTVRFSTKPNIFIWFEDIISLVEREASCEIYSLLKRKDEKFVTEKAYENPKFVEDIARDVALRLKEHNGIDWFEVEVENFESIHTHNAYAFIRSDNVNQ